MRWTKEAIIEDAKKYQLKTDWHKASSQAYRKARDLGIFEQATSHMGKKPKWTKAKLLKEKEKYANRTEWVRSSPYSFFKAKEMGLLMETRTQLTEDDILEAQAKYETIKEWRENDEKSYKAAHYRGIIGRPLKKKLTFFEVD